MKSIGQKSIHWIARTLRANGASRLNGSLACGVGFFYGVGFNVPHRRLLLPIRRAQVVVAIPANKKRKSRVQGRRLALPSTLVSVLPHELLVQVSLGVGKALPRD